MAQHQEHVRVEGSDPLTESSEASHRSPDPATELDSESTESRILEGALRTMGRQGTDRLRMNAVSDAAGVARGTLYRYFPTKTHLFAALVDYERRRFAEALQSAIDQESGRPRVDVFLDFVVVYMQEHPALDRLLQDEPEFVLRYLRRHFAFLRQTASRFIAPFAGDELGDSDVAEVVLRVLIANFLVPPDSPKSVNRTIRAVLGQVATVDD